ncbi:MAG: CvpA family protein [Bacteroidales bacterium]|nr:CvpA family protein [Bacteroidales bacterium]
MNLLDIIFAVPMVYFIWKGYKKGIIFEFASLFGVVAGTYAAFHFSKLVSELIGLRGESSVLIAFFITFVAVLLLSMLFGKCVQGLVKLVKAGVLDHLLGAALGWIKCVCILGVVVSYVSMVDRNGLLLRPELKQNSFFYAPIGKAGDKLTGALAVYVRQVRAERHATKS